MFPNVRAEAMSSGCNVFVLLSTSEIFPHHTTCSTPYTQTQSINISSASPLPIDHTATLKETQSALPRTSSRDRIGRSARPRAPARWISGPVPSAAGRIAHAPHVRRRRLILHSNELPASVGYRPRLDCPVLGWRTAVAIEWNGVVALVAEKASAYDWELG